MAQRRGTHDVSAPAKSKVEFQPKQDKRRSGPPPHGKSPPVFSRLNRHRLLNRQPATLHLASTGTTQHLLAFLGSIACSVASVLLCAQSLRFHSLPAWQANAIARESVMVSSPATRL